MFRGIILPIFRSARLCVTACGITHPRCCRLVAGRPAASWLHYTTSCNTQFIAPEDGQNNCPKHVELTGIINKSLLLHLVGCLYYLCIFFLRLAKQSQFIPLQNVVYFITLAFLVLKIFTFSINNVYIYIYVSLYCYTFFCTGEK